VSAGIETAYAAVVRTPKALNEALAFVWLAITLARVGARICQTGNLLEILVGLGGLEPPTRLLWAAGSLAISAETACFQWFSCRVASARDGCFWGETGAV